MIISIETPETSFSPELDNVSCRFSFEIAVVNPAGEGEHSQLKIIDCESTIMTFLIFLRGNKNKVIRSVIGY